VALLLIGPDLVVQQVDQARAAAERWSGLLEPQAVT